MTSPDCAAAWWSGTRAGRDAARRRMPAALAVARDVLPNDLREQFVETTSPRALLKRWEEAMRRRGWSDGDGRNGPLGSGWKYGKGGYGW